MSSPLLNRNVPLGRSCGVHSALATGKRRVPGMRGRIATAGRGRRQGGIGGRRGGGESAARLAIARPDGSWALGLRARASPNARGREVSAPQISEGAAERAGPGLTPRLPRPLARPEHERGPGRRLTGEQSALIEHEETPVEELADLDATA